MISEVSKTMNGSLLISFHIWVVLIQFVETHDLTVSLHCLRIVQQNFPLRVVTHKLLNIIFLEEEKGLE